MYSVGRGPSATTVSIQNDVITHGDTVLLKGTVMDIAAGTKQNGQAARFPNGVPAISDDDMTEWMEYLYMQQEMPMNAKGVKVTLDAFDENGNHIPIGSATSDMSGLYSIMWTPETEGKYTIIATFEGSKSYYSSYAETAIGVDPAPTEPETEPETEEPLFTTAELAILAAVVILIIIALIGILILRKR